MWLNIFCSKSFSLCVSNFSINFFLLYFFNLSEHVKKRHLSILEGNEEAEDFEIEAWRETRKITNPTNPSQTQQQVQSLNKLNYDKNTLSNPNSKNLSTSLNNNLQIAQRRRKPFNPSLFYL